MDKQKFSFKIFLCLVQLFAVTPLLFAQESISFTSYYPSPFGTYDRVRFVPRPTILAAECNNATLGVVYYDQSTQTLQICNDPGTGPVWSPIGPAGSTIWTRNAGTNVIYPTNFTTDRLAVGTDAPINGAILTVVGGRVIVGQFGSTSFQGGAFNLSDSAWMGNREAIYSLDGVRTDGDVFVDTGNITINNGDLSVNGTTQITDDGATADTSAYATFGVTRSAAAANQSYIGLTKQGTIPWGIGIGSTNNLIMGVAQAGRTINTPFLSLSNVGYLGVGSSAPIAPLHVTSNGVVPLWPHLLIEGSGASSMEPRIALVDTAIGGGSVTTSPAWLIDTSFDQFRIFRQPNLSSMGLVYLSINNGGNISTPYNTWDGVQQTCSRSSGTAGTPCFCPDGYYMVGYSGVGGANNDFTIYCRQL